MKSMFAQWGLMAALIYSLAGCGGGSNSAPASTPTGGSSTTGAATVQSLAAQEPAAHDPTKNDQAPWNALVALGIAPVTIQSPPVVNFAVLDAVGKPVSGLKLSGADTACGGNNVRFAMGKFDGANWQSLIPSGLAAVTDPVDGATLQENAGSGYYTYRFSTNVAAVKDGATVHRVGIQLCFVDPQSGTATKVNPFLDFTVGADGVGVPVKDSQNKLAAIKKVVDKASCNECHQTLAARHDAGLVNPNMCVICHNPSSTHFATGNSLDFKLMIHKFHMGKKLKKDYRLSSFVARLDSGGTITGVDYPQDQRNCVKCHDGSASAVNKTPNGDNWKTQASKNACFACHDDYKDTTSKWYAKHQGAPGVDRNNPDATSDSTCAGCHGDTAPKINTSAKHAVPEWTLAANYQYNIHAVTWNADRTVSVEFSVSNPTDGTTYNILDTQYRYTTVNTAGTTTTRNFVFGRLGLLFGWGSGDYGNAGAIAATSWGTSCTTAVATGTPTCNSTTGLPTSTAGGALLARGLPVTVSIFDAVPVAGSNNRFKATSTPLPASVSGTGVVALQGRISLQKDANTSYSVPVKNVVSYFAIGGSGTPVARRTVVSADKCNGCHGKNINGHGHGGGRTEPEVCVICHNGNNVLGTTVTGGVVTAQPDSAHFKRMIHKLHKDQGANYPVLPNTSRTAVTAAGTYIGYTGVRNCTLCHVGDSYKTDLGTIGSSTVLEVNLATNSTNATITDTDPSNNPAISPKAAACSSCHSDDTAKNHMISVGGAAFGTVTQADIAAGKVAEGCNGCHAPGSAAGVDTKHGLR